MLESDFPFDRTPRHSRLYVVAAMMMLMILLGLMMLSLSDGTPTRLPIQANVLHAEVSAAE